MTHPVATGADSSPVPANNPAAAAAMEEAGRRLAMVRGTWEALAKADLTEKLGRVRSTLTGRPNITENPLKQLSEEVSTAYDSEPSVSHQPESAADVDSNAEEMAALDEQLESCGRWLVAQQLQVELEAVNEALLYFSWVSRDGETPGRLNCEIASMDRVHFLPYPGDSKRLGRVSWARQEWVKDPMGKRKKVWTWHVWDIRPEKKAPLEKGEPSRPYFRVLSQDEEDDLTGQIVTPGEWQGEKYPWRTEAGEPLLPFQLFHRRFPASGALKDPWSGSEVVAGTLQAAINWTNLDHAAMRASWSVRGVIGGRVQGASKPAAGTSQSSPMMTLPDDPTKVWYVRHDGEGSASTFEFGSPVDLEKHEGVFRRSSARLAVHFGLSASDIQITTNAPQSGIAIKVSREGKRRIAAKRIPNLRRGDLESFVIVSAILRNNPDGDPIAVLETGYRIEYAAIELSVEERMEITEGGLLEVEAGVLTRVDLRRRLHPGETEADAFLALARSEVEAKVEEASRTPEGLTLMLDMADGRLSVEEARIALMELAKKAPPPAPPPPEAPTEEEIDTIG